MRWLRLRKKFKNIQIFLIKNQGVNVSFSDDLHGNQKLTPNFEIPDYKQDNKISDLDNSEYIEICEGKNDAIAKNKETRK